MRAPFNIRISESEGLKLIDTYESYVQVPENNGNIGIRYQSKNIVKSLRESMRRTKKTIKELAFGTQWDYFITFTLDSKKINRYSRQELLKAMNSLLTQERRKNPDFQYLFIPEFHKDKAIHLHGFIKNVQNVKFSGKYNVYGRKIYNWKTWSSKLGHTRMDYLPKDMPIKERFATYLYTLKYITADLVVGTALSETNKKRYFASKSLPRPKAKYQLVDDVLFHTASYLDSDKILSYRTHEVNIFTDDKITYHNIKHEIAIES